MQIIASTQNEKLLNLATSASDRNTDRSSGMDFSYLFNLAKTSDSIKASSVKQQNKATRTDRNTQSLYDRNKNSFSDFRKENTVSFKQDKVAKKSSSYESSSVDDRSDPASVLKNQKVDPFKNFDESESADIKAIKEQVKKEYLNYCVDEVNTDVITDKENNKTVQGQILNNYKLLETPKTYADVQAESRPITEEDIELLESLKNAENMKPDEISDPNAKSLTDIFLKSTFKIKEEDEVDGEQTDEETEEKTANNIADNVKKPAIKDPSSSDKTLKTQIA